MDQQIILYSNSSVTCGKKHRFPVGKCKFGVLVWINYGILKLLGILVVEGVSSDHQLSHANSRSAYLKKEAY